MEEEAEQRTDLESKAVPARKEKNESFWAWVRNMVIMVAVLLLFFKFVARPSQVYGQSMENTCHDGDLVILWELNYRPTQGDVVVIDHNNPLQENLIKRVIAVEGDHLQINEGVVTVNGQRLQETYVKDTKWGQGEAQVDLTVPQGQTFVMGDNRNHSSDSRVIGPVQNSAIMGKVVFRLFPFHVFGVLPNT